MNKILPPTRVFLEATSPRKNHTQTGPRTTSANDNRVKSAADSVLDPIVYSTRPPPTWKIPIENDMPISCDEIKRDCFKNKQIKKVIIIAKQPDKNTDGSISSFFPHLNATEKMAKPIAEPNAAKLPVSEKCVDWSANMYAIPPIATIIAYHVVVRTCSPRIKYPRTAAINGAVANSSIAFATEVV